MIATNVIIPFDGNHADIPSGYTRETTLDSKYPKATADGTDPDDTGGNSTHTHTSSSHTHTLNAHTHTGTSGSRSGGESEEAASNGNNAAKLSHTHTYTSGAKSGGTTNGTTVTYGAVSNDPLYYTVIFIKSTGYNTIPNNAMVFSTATSRDSLTFHVASANKFLKGAGTGANAGSTGGSTTNIHSINHTHTTNTHTHIGGNTSGTATGYESNLASDTATYNTHTHTFTVAAGTQTIGSYSGSLTTGETVQPVYKTLNTYKNTSGSSTKAEIGDIGLWLGTLATIPAGWTLCDGTSDTPDMRGRHFKTTASATASTTGGSNTNTHAAQSHTHSTGSSHAHTASFGNVSAGRNRVGDGNSIIKGTHTHNNSTSSSGAIAYASGSTSANSSSNEPEYRTVAYIQLKTISGEAGFLLNFI